MKADESMSSCKMDSLWFRWRMVSDFFSGWKAYQRRKMAMVRTFIKDPEEVDMDQMEMELADSRSCSQISLKRS